jgi:hypothetical protein
LLTFIVIRGKIFGFGIDNPYELYWHYMMYV